MAKGEFCCSENVIHEGAVAEVREKMHSGEALDTVAGFFKVLGDGTRMRMISALAVRELCVCDLAAVLGMTKSAVSHQLGTCLLYTSYFFTFGRFRISSRQLSQVSPAVMRRSIEMAQESATAQRLGLV